MENERFANPKLQRLYEALLDLFPLDGRISAKKMAK